jgi:predicted DNA-binding transcriptional regulator AlpA
MTLPADPGEMLSVAEVIGMLKVSRRTFYRWRELRIAPESIRLPNGELRITRAALAAWLDDLQERAA